ncbi:MAG: N-acetyltransferase [Firmicutes bacterium]|nr:N-acetyltransferase [Bacillota bacterium]
MDITVRESIPSDLPIINKIFNYAVLNTNYNLRIEPRSQEEAQQWFEKHKAENYPILSAVYQGEVVGWASLSHFREYEGYNTTAEVSVYVSKSYRHRGIGTMLLTELERRAKRYRLLIAVITDNNTASISLHSRCGFIPVCTLREIGCKNGEYISVTLMSKKLKNNVI